MRELNIAYGNNRQAKRWVNKTIKFDDLKERLRVPIRTTESAEEYAKMSHAQRDAAKDHGGFVAGVLKGGRRKVDTVESRSMVALDGDRINAAFLESYESLCPYTSALYTTHSSTEGKSPCPAGISSDQGRDPGGICGGVPLSRSNAGHRLF